MEFEGFGAGGVSLQRKLSVLHYFLDTVNSIHTSELDCRESTSPCENRTGVSLTKRSVIGKRCQNRSGRGLTSSIPVT